MCLKKISKITNKFTFFGLLVTGVSFSEPFLPPNDPFIRHEIRMLADEGGLDSIQNTWPIDFGGLVTMQSGFPF